jgi:hypothetical protein
MIFQMNLKEKLPSSADQPISLPACDAMSAKPFLLKDSQFLVNPR